MDSRDKLYSVVHNLHVFSDSLWPYLISFCVGLIAVIRMYMGGSVCPSDDRIDDKVAIITGASSGIGKEIALELARRGGRIILAVRDVVAGEKVARQIRDVFGRNAEVRAIDLSSLKSVQNFVDQLDTEKVDMLVNNAGIVFHPFEKTTEGFEIHFVTNYLVELRAHTISAVHLEDLNLERNFTAREAFSQSKLALILMARHMSKLLRGTSVTINAVNPGIVRGTRHMRYSPLNSTFLIKLIMQPWMWLFLKSAVQGAQTAVYVAVSRELHKHSGKYFSDCQVQTPSADAINDIMAEKLYDKSLLLVRPYMQKSQNNHEE